MEVTVTKKETAIHIDFIFFYLLFYNNVFKGGGFFFKVTQYSLPAQLDISKVPFNSKAITYHIFCKP